MDHKSGSSMDPLEVPLVKPLVQLCANVVYAQTTATGYPNVVLHMDILVPQAEGPLPVVLFLPGGGFITANKENSIQQRLNLVERGYVVASMEYRTVPEVRFPAPLEDVKAAVRFLRANAAQFGVEPSKIALCGMSAGGYLATFAAVTNGDPRYETGDYLDVSSDVQAVVNYYGVSDLTGIATGMDDATRRSHAAPSSAESLLINGLGTEDGIMDVPEKAAAANPLNFITQAAPPFLILHGDEDTTVSPSQTKMLYDALQAKGVPSSYHIVHGAHHGGAHWVQPAILDRVKEFLDTYLT